MPTPLQLSLQTMGHCLTTINARIDATGVTHDLLERKIAFGIARDHARWAASLQDLVYSRRSENESDRKPVFLEGMRFSHLWTATDALFSRPSLHLITGAPSGRSELQKFTNLFSFSALSPNVISTARSQLLNLLNIEVHVTEPLPGAIPANLRVWKIIYYKYTVALQRKRSMGRYMRDCLANGTPFSPDLCPLIYASRNWHFHGVFGSSAFRGPAARPLVYYKTLNSILSQFLQEFASRALPHL